MDERRKIIGEYEAKRRDSLHTLDLLFENFGRSILEGAAEAAEPKEEEFRLEYRRLQEDIKENTGRISSIEAEAGRIKALDEDIRSLEAEERDLNAKQCEMLCRLGRLARGGPRMAEKNEEALLLEEKIGALKAKIQDNEGSRSNIFVWIGRNAQTLLFQLRIRKNQERLDKLFMAMGEAYAAVPEEAVDGETAGILGELNSLKERAAALNEEAERLRGERHSLQVILGESGGPVKHIAGLEKRIEGRKQELAALYKTCARYCAEKGAPAGEPLEKIRLQEGIIRELDGNIETLRAAVEIDEKKAEIAGLKRAVEDRKNRIEEYNKAIEDFEGRIETAEKRIGELTPLAERKNI
jgi:predicted  nucleic acid-binding Zn-ribbon protein